MARYVPDAQTHRWVIISSQRLGRPHDKKKPTRRVCPFCGGNEKLTPSEIMRIGDGDRDKPGWKVRVIPNKFPITDIHEVFIHSPTEDNDLDTLHVSHVKMILSAYVSRYNFHKKQGQVMIFRNHGIHAGASLMHPHSQLVVLPFQINVDTLTREPKANVVEEKEHFLLYCPDFSQWPYELWIVPKKEGTVFGSILDEEMSELAHIFQWSIRKMRKLYTKSNITDVPFAYNYYIYPKENWYLRIIPRFVNRAGFELGTGLSVNIIDPAEAAEEFKKE